MSDVDELIEEIERRPEGPEVGAFFDLDGTLIAGYSANVFYQEFVRAPADVGPASIARSLAPRSTQCDSGARTSTRLDARSRGLVPGASRRTS